MTTTTAASLNGRHNREYIALDNGEGWVPVLDIVARDRHGVTVTVIARNGNVIRVTVPKYQPAAIV